MGKNITKDTQGKEGPTSKNVTVAIQSLRCLVNKEKEDLMEDSSTKSVFIVLSMFKIPKMPISGIQRPLTIKLNVPHNFREQKEILLITQDTKKVKLKGDWEKSITRYNDLLTRHNARNLVSQILPLHQLRIEYRDYEAKRNLSNMFDFVLCDDTVINRVPLFLGKSFYGKKKRPVAVNLKANDMQEELSKVIRRAYLNLDFTGNTAMVEIGNLGLQDGALVENILAAVRAIKKKIPGSQKNIQSLYIKTRTSKSIPLYLNLGSRAGAKSVKHPTKEFVNSFVVDELPSGGYVKVYRDGTTMRLSEEQYQHALKVESLKKTAAKKSKT